MAERRVQLDQETFSCSICLDLLKDPVTIPCGHSYCSNCIKDYWNIEDETKIPSCPQCRQTFRPKPVLMKNTMLAHLVEELKKSGLQAAPADHCYAGPEDVDCDVCTGRKLKALKSCLICLISYCEQHLQPHFESPAFAKHKLVDPSKTLQENICSRHVEVMNMLCCNDQQCVCYFCRTDEQKAAAERTVRQGVQPEPNTRAGFLKYSRKLTVDPNTANQFMVLFKGNSRVTRMTPRRFCSNPPHCFEDWPQVLSKQALTGRCYWEVEGAGEGFFVAAAYKNIRRDGGFAECAVGHNDKSWALRCQDGIFSFVYDNILIPVSGPPSSRVGVYLDHSAGILSFYSVTETMTLLHRVQTTFTQPLYAAIRFYFFGDTAEFCKLK